MPTSILDLPFLHAGARRRIAIVAIASGFVGVLLAILLPRWYESVLTVVPAKSQRSGVSGLLGGAGDLAALAGADAAGVAADGPPRVAAVLESISVSDAVIDKFDLQRRYSAKYREVAREKLWEHCDVKTLAKPALVQLTCEDRDPAFVQRMLQYFAEYGNEVFRRVSVSSATEEVRFLERRVAELRRQADQASGQMREFQERYQLVDLETQSKAVVGAIASLQSQRISKQLELDYARTFSSPYETTTQQLATQISVIDQQLKELERSNGASPAHGGRKGAAMFPPALDVPRLRADFERLHRDRTVAEASVVFALQRLEAAKANEARDVSTFLVLDPPALPTKPRRPSPVLLIAVALAVGVASALLREWYAAGGLAAFMASSVARPVPAEEDHDASIPRAV